MDKLQREELTKSVSDLIRSLAKKAGALRKKQMETARPLIEKVRRLEKASRIMSAVFNAAIETDPLLRAMVCGDATKSGRGEPEGERNIEPESECYTGLHEASEPLKHRRRRVCTFRVDSKKKAYELIEPIIATMNETGEPLVEINVRRHICKKTGQRLSSLKRNKFVKKAIEETIEFLNDEQHRNNSKCVSYEDLALMNHSFMTDKS